MYEDKKIQAGNVRWIQEICKTDILSAKEFSDQGATFIYIAVDEKPAAGTIGQQLGIDDIYAECLPEDKLKYE